MKAMAATKMIVTNEKKSMMHEREGGARLPCLGRKERLVSGLAG